MLDDLVAFVTKNRETGVVTTAARSSNVTNAEQRLEYAPYRSLGGVIGGRICDAKARFTQSM